MTWRSETRSGVSPSKVSLPCARRVLALALAVSVFATTGSAQGVNIDGGRSELPGMKQDIFDQVQRNKRSGGAQPTKGKAPPECPKSDGMSPFMGLAFADKEIYVKFAETEGKCQRLISVGGMNYTSLANASRTCGPAGEWKQRIALNMSSLFFQGGFDWVKSENQTLEVVTEGGSFELAVTEEAYESQIACWKYGCGCEQANNPVMRRILLAMLVIAGGGLSWDSIKLLWQKIKGQKPPKHVQCKKGHRLEEVRLARTHYCDMCGTAGTMYQCSVSCNYDMCKACYKSEKKKVKAAWKDWCERHPEDKDKAKKDDNEDNKEDDEDNTDKKSDGKAESEDKTDKDEVDAKTEDESDAKKEEESDARKEDAEDGDKAKDEDGKDADAEEKGGESDGKGGSKA